MFFDEKKEEELQNLFIKFFAEQEIIVKLIRIDGQAWNDVLKNIRYVPVVYTPAVLKYQACYLRCFVKKLIDLSVVIYYAGKPIGIWPIFLKIDDEEVILITNEEGTVYKPLFINSNTAKFSKKMYEVCLTCLSKMYMLIKEYIVPMYVLGRGEIGKEQGRLLMHPYWEGTHLFFMNEVDEWYRKCMGNNATATVRHELYVDLAKDYDEIKKNIRKSFKSLVNLGERLWDVKVYDEIEDAVFEEYRQLHYQVSGRITRSLETWELQKQAINNHDAFLVALYDENHVLVGGGLFEISKDEAVYGVGVYKRELFDKPLGHVVQMQAIQHMQKLGLKWYKIGCRPYKGDSVMPTDKECDIGYFKEGFATHMFLRVLTKCNFNSI